MLNSNYRLGVSPSPSSTNPPVLRSVVNGFSTATQSVSSYLKRIFPSESIRPMVAAVSVIGASAVVIYLIISKKKKKRPVEYVKRTEGKFHLLIACTGSVASIKLAEMIQEIRRHCGQHSSNVEIRVIATENAMKFFDGETVAGLNDGIPVFTDEDEWTTWKQRGDPVLHIELRKWADLMLIAPLDANTLAKIANGICDNLVTSVVRAWDPKKPLYFAPAMNTYMWENPITLKQVETLRGFYKEMPCIEKCGVCGDMGYGAMTTVATIGEVISGEVKKYFAIYTA